MYSVTMFEWRSGKQNTTLAIPAFKAQKGEPSLFIKNLTIGVVNNLVGFMDMEFTLSGGKYEPLSDASEFVAKVVQGLHFGGYSNSGWKYNFTLDPESGEPLTESMMKKLMLLIDLCGVYLFVPPRIVTETFTGRWCGDLSEGSGVPYGKYLMDKCLREKYNTK